MTIEEFRAYVKGLRFDLRKGDAKVVVLEATGPVPYQTETKFDFPWLAIAPATGSVESSASTMVTLTFSEAARRGIVCHCKIIIGRMYFHRK